MKKIVFALSLLWVTYGTSQQAQFSFQLQFDSPHKSIMPQMQTNVSFGGALSYRPVFGFPMMVEVKMGFGTYANESEHVKVNFQNYLYNPVTVNFQYKNKMNKYLIGTKWLIGYDFRAVRGFATPQIGFTNFRTLTSYSYTLVDDNNNDDNDNSYSDRSRSQGSICGVYGGEVGIEILLNKIFSKKITTKDLHRLYISTGILRSFSPIKYTNVNNLIDLDEGSTTIENTPYIDLDHSLYSDNKKTELYRTNLSMWSLNFGYILNIQYDDEEPPPPLE